MQDYINNSKNTTADIKKLREIAESKVDNLPDIPDKLDYDEVVSIAHELQVHQVELELQNEELQITQTRLAKARDNYRNLYDFAPTGYASISGHGHIIQANHTLASMLMVDRKTLLNSPFSQYIASEYQDVYHIFRQKLLQGIKTHSTEIKLTQTNGSEFVAVVKGTIFESDAKTPTIIHIAITDINKLRTARLAEQRHKVMSDELRKSALLLNQSLDLSAVLKNIIQLAKNIVKYDASQLVLLEESEVKIIVRTESNGSFELIDVDDNFELSSRIQRSINERQSLSIPDLFTESARNNYYKFFPRMRSYLCVPIQAEEYVIGYIEVYGTEPDYFSTEHRYYLEQFTAHAALAIKNAQLVDASRELLMLQERQKIANDLHDNVTQMLFSSSIIVEALSKSDDLTWIKKYLTDLYQLNRGALSEMNNVLLELRTDQAPRINLAHLLEQLSRAVTGRSGITVKSDIQRHKDLPIDLQLAFYRIARQAMDNIINYANANQIMLHLKVNAKMIIMEITDDGKGFNPNVMKNSSSIYSYANSENLEISIQSAEGKGTTISVIGTIE